MNPLQAFRSEKDGYFAYNPQSPLTREQKQTFKGLDYFPEAPELRFELTVDAFPDRTEIEIQTSTGDVQTYIRYGKIRFPVEGQDVELTIYANENGFFLPFVDSL